MVARIQPLLLDGILTANTLPRYFGRVERGALRTVDVVRRCHHSDDTSVSGAAGQRCQDGH